MSRKKAVSIALMAFTALAIAILAITYLQYNTYAGKTIGEISLENLQLITLSDHLQKVHSFIKNDLAMVAPRTCQNVSKRGGWTEGDREDIRFWYCDTKRQPPEETEVQYYANELTLEEMKERVNIPESKELPILVDVDPPTCMNTGYRYEEDAEEASNSTYNDYFTVALDVPSLSVDSGNMHLEKINFTVENEVYSDRFWYMYAIIKDWIQTMDPPEDKLKEELEKIPDLILLTKCGDNCPCPTREDCIKQYLCVCDNQKDAIVRFGTRLAQDLESRFDKEVRCKFSYEAWVPHRMGYTTKCPMKKQCLIDCPACGHAGSNLDVCTEEAPPSDFCLVPGPRPTPTCKTNVSVNKPLTSIFVNPTVEQQFSVSNLNVSVYEEGQQPPGPPPEPNGGPEKPGNGDSGKGGSGSGGNGKGIGEPKDAGADEVCCTAICPWSFHVGVNATITCTDRKYKSVPDLNITNKLDYVIWQIRLYVYAEDDQTSCKNCPF